MKYPFCLCKEGGRAALGVVFRQFIVCPSVCVYGLVYVRFCNGWQAEEGEAALGTGRTGTRCIVVLVRFGAITPHGLY